MSKTTSNFAGNAEWKGDDCDRYAAARHGPDGAALLHPALRAALESCCKGKRVIDIACGTGDWSVLAGKFGAVVTAVDLASEMLERIRTLVESNNLSDRILVETADACSLPYEEGSFDVAFSFNLGSMLSSKAVELHMLEMKRVLRPNGRALMNVPASLKSVFTSGARDQMTIQREVNFVLDTIEADTSPDEIKSKLSQFADIYRASFIIRKSRLLLVNPETHLTDGEPTWRKIAGLVVQNVYHSEQEYLSLAARVGLSLETIQKPTFASAADLTSFNCAHSAQTLGPE